MEQHYREQAAACLREAEAATLDHVRERFRRSGSAWLAMADQAARTARFKRTNDAMREAAE